MYTLTSRLLKNPVSQPIFSMFATTTNGEMGGDPRGVRGHRYDIASYSTLQTDSSRCGQNLGDANEIVSGRRQHEEPFDQRPSAMSSLAQPAHGLHPTECFFDLLSLDRADVMTGMPGSPTIDRRAAVSIVLRDVRSAAALATTGDEIGCVVILVAAHRAAGSGIVVDHVEAGRALGGAVGFGQTGIDDERIAVLHHQMSHVAELCLLAGSLAKQAGIRIRSRRMRVILTFLAMEIALGIAPSARRRRNATILRDETLHAGPGLDQRAVDREVLARQQLADLRQVQ